VLRARFKLPYTHKIFVREYAQPVSLTIKQQRFKEEGFASTGSPFSDVL